ncbi:MAG: acetyltransferase [Phaeospirillum sp.]|nr:acetyltransferase [Phaeospirillum sp.]
MTAPAAPISLVILGASGNSADIIDMVAAINAAQNGEAFEVAGILDDRAQGVWHGVPVLGGLAGALALPPRTRFVNAIGSTNTHWKRDAIIAATSLAPEHFVSIIHPSAQVSASARLGLGVVLYPGVVVGASARLDSHALVLANSVINHDCVVGTHSCLASGILLSGGVRIGACAYLGAGANVLPGLTIGERTLVGAGAIVTRDVEADMVVAGSPARVLRRRQQENAPS